MKQFVSGIAIALALAAMGAPRAHAFTMQTIENTNPDGTAKFADPDERTPFGNPAPAASSQDSGTRNGINLGPNFGLSFSNGGSGNNGARSRDPRLGLVPGDINNNDGGGRTFFGGMPDSLGPN